MQSLKYFHICDSYWTWRLSFVWHIVCCFFDSSQQSMFQCGRNWRLSLIGSLVLCCLMADNPVDKLISSYRQLLTDLGNGLTEWSGCNLWLKECLHALCKHFSLHSSLHFPGIIPITLLYKKKNTVTVIQVKTKDLFLWCATSSGACVAL